MLKHYKLVTFNQENQTPVFGTPSTLGINNLALYWISFSTESDWQRMI